MRRRWSSANAARHLCARIWDRSDKTPRIEPKGHRARRRSKWRGRLPERFQVDRLRAAARKMRRRRSWSLFTQGEDANPAMPRFSPSAPQCPSEWRGALVARCTSARSAPPREPGSTSPRRSRREKASGQQWGDCLACEWRLVSTSEVLSVPASLRSQGRSASRRAGNPYDPPKKRAGDFGAGPVVRRRNLVGAPDGPAPRSGQ